MKLHLLILLFSPLSTPLFAQGSWNQIASLPGAGRTMAVGTTISGIGYVALGYNGSGALDSFWAYDPSTGSWTQKADYGGDGTRGGIAMSINSKGYFGLGWNAQGHNNDLWEYDPLTNVWLPCANFGGGGRSYAVSFSIGSKGYVGTGESNSGWEKDLWEYDPVADSWTQKASMGGSERVEAIATSVGNKGYVGLGKLSATVYTDDLWEYDQGNNIWTQKANFPGGPLASGTSFSLLGNVCVGSGVDTALTNNFWKFDPGTNLWSPITSFSGSLRKNGVSFVIGERAYFGTGVGFLSDFWQYNPWDYSFTLSSDSVCLGTSITVTNKTTDPSAYTYRWRFVNGSYHDSIFDTLSTTIPYTFDSLPGTWNVLMDVYDSTYQYLGGHSIAVHVSVFNTVTALELPDTCGQLTGAAFVNISGGTAPFTYLWAPGAITTQMITGQAPGNYTLALGDRAGCVETKTVSITLNPTPVVLISGPDTICGTGSNNTITASGGLSYVWYPSGQTSSAIVIASSINSTYTVVGTDVNGCSNSDRVTVSFITMQDSLVFSATCGNADGSGLFYVNGGIQPFSYLWSNGNTNYQANNLSAGTHTLTILDKGGCSISDTINIPLGNQTVAPICMVTVDSLSQNNVIIWDKSAYQHVDSFFIYREVGLNNFQPVGAVAYDSLSLFVDTVRTKYFPNTGNPNTGTYKYKLQILDSCGSKGQLGQDHNTIFIINNNGTFSWPQLYLIGGTSNPVNNYVLMRDNLSNGNWQVVSSVAGSQQTITDPQYAQYQSMASWRVVTQWSISCTPTRQGEQVLGFNSSLSNVFSLTTGVNELYNNPQVRIIPNPSRGEFRIITEKVNPTALEIIDLSGKTSVVIPISGTKELLKTNLAPGFYTYRIYESGTIISIGKMIIQE